MTTRTPDPHTGRGGGRRFAFAAAILVMLLGCSHVGRLQYVAQPVSPVSTDSTELKAFEGSMSWIPLFGDTAIGLVPGTADSSIRFLGRLRSGYAADTLNIILCGDNRPGYRIGRIAPQLQTIRQGLSLNPLKVLHALVTIPYAIAKGLYPDFALIRDIPTVIKGMPEWGREREVMEAMLVKIDSLEAHGQDVAAVINLGDVVKDGRTPAHWERFLRLTHPLTSRVPYFPVPGNHERTDTEQGIENWWTATGLPVGGDRLYYCFDSADGWVRFIALDSNPIVNAGSHWTREVQIKHSEEQLTWLAERVKEHRGPVLALLHHPPFSAGTHRLQWERDELLIEQRERLVRTLHESGIAVVASGHDHSYQRALFTWPDAVLIVLVSGGAGSPLHDIPLPAESARLFSEYKVAGSVVTPKNVFTNHVFNFTHLRFWFGGGDFYSFAVDENSKTTLIDKVEIDLNRYGTPEIDQRKMVIPPSKGPSEPSEDKAGTPADSTAATADSTSASERFLSKPPPSGVSEQPGISPDQPDTVSVKPQTPQTPQTPAPGTGRPR